MKVTFLLATIFFFTLVIAEESDDEIFEKYALKFKIHFRRNANLTEQRDRVAKKFREFSQQEKKFEEGDEQFTRSLYQFSYLSDQDFAEYHLGALEPEANETIYINETEEAARRGRAFSEPPETSFQWPDSVVGRVKSQGSCGSCYAFAAVNAIQSQLALKYGIYNYDLSEQDAMECTRGCSGGWDYSIYRDYSQKFGGVAAYNWGSIHSYTGVSTGCKATSRTRVPYTKVITYGILANNEKTIRTYLYNIGPLYTRFDVQANFYEYSSGIYNYASGNRIGGHAVLLTGWGESNGVKYWIIKNSWDSWWGEKGYFRMLRGKNLCGIEASVSAITNI